MTYEPRLRPTRAPRVLPTDGRPRPLARWLPFVLGLLLVGCRHEAHHAASLPHFPATTPLRRDTEVTTELVCQIRAIQHIEIRALERGYLNDVYVDEGQTVRAGQHLFQITPVIYQAEFARSAAEARAAEVEYENVRTLRDGNVVSANQLALSQANLQRAHAERELAQARLRFTSLDAPFPGIVGRFHARRGSLLEEGAILTELSDNRTMWVYFNVSEAQYLDYRAHHPANDPVPVRLRMANGQLFDQVGTIQTIESDFNNETGTIAFRAGFSNPQGLLRHGETGKVLLSSVIERALLIPQKATFRILDKTFVFVVDSHGVVHSREIEVSEQAIPHLYIVEKGLTENDHVLLDGIRRVRDGDRIAPAMHPPEEVFRELDVPAY
ncbi:MAG: efflux RND transporter periplasmic adaptor subunit [Polyangiales bacterium]